VTAQSEEGVWWGAGYAVAQDRLFQLELFRRATTGRLAEILGESFLDDDLIARRDYYTADERRAMLDRLSPSIRLRIAAYRDGVTRGSRMCAPIRRICPGEFPAVGAELRDWTRTTASPSASSSPDRPERQRRRAREPALAARDDPCRPSTACCRCARRAASRPSRPTRVRSPRSPAAPRPRSARRWRARSSLQGVGAASEEATASARANVAPGLVGQLGGSYMFVAKRPTATPSSSTGRSWLLDPELFVELELHGPGLDVRGVTAAGVPIIGIGHNGKVAWGFTSGLSDEDDLYAEELAGPEQYRFNGETRTMECRDERFDFRSPPTDATDFPEVVPGAGSRNERICRTVHGPVEVRADGTAYARRYAIWMRELETIEGLARLNAAQNIQDVDAAMQQVTWNENVMAADSHGNIGFWHPGLHPLRPAGYDERLPYPGTGEAEWSGLMDRRQTPHVINPKQGWLSNWNNVPSEGWTAGDSAASERNSGRYHRNSWLGGSSTT
jgi:penicillin amidase